MKTEPVLIFNAVNECFETLKIFFDIFTMENDNTKPVLCLTDKDLKERKIINNFFPNCKMRLCYFHIMQNFNRRLATTIKNKTVRIIELRKTKKLFKSSTQKDFDNCRNTLLPEVKAYFEKNWFGYRTESISYFMIHTLTIEV